jgi:nitrite reductase/ring-hydroxylating ferredoxin subunit
MSPSAHDHGRRRRTGRTSGTDQDSARDSPVDGDGVPRRTMLRGVAVGGLTVPLLAACGGGSGSSGSGGSGSDSSSSKGSSGGGSGGSATVAEADVPVGGGTILTDAKVVVTQPTKGRFNAFSAICTHQGCLVNEVSGGQIVCPCHGSHFSITDGSPVSGPAPSALPAKKVRVAGGRVSVT